MPRSTSRRCAFLVLAVTVAACSADNGTDPSSTGTIRVTLTYQGSSVQEGVATVTLTGLNQTPKVTGNVFLFTGLAPDTYVAEPRGVPAGCLVVGARQDSVTVVAGNTADATFAIRCSASNQLLVVSPGDIAQGGHLFTSFAIVNADGTDFHELFPGVLPPLDPTWSSDGGRIAFHYDQSASDEKGVWTVHSDGTDMSLFWPGSDSEPVLGVSWSPDGAHLAIRTAVATNSSRSAGNVHVVTDDGMHDTPLPHPAGMPTSYTALDWSPTGDRLAVSVELRDSEQQPIGYSLHIFRSDGTDETGIDVVAFAIRWSPVGDRIAFMRVNELYTVRPDGTDLAPVRLGTNFTFDWAPDGSRLAVVTDDGVRVVNVDSGGDVLVLPGTNDAWPESVAWSPSGDKLAVVTTKLSGDLPEKVNVMNVDGSGLIDVTGDTPYQIALWRP